MPARIVRQRRRLHKTEIAGTAGESCAAETREVEQDCGWVVRPGPAGGFDSLRADDLLTSRS